MKAYYGSRFSPNRTKTPEGYLICHNVPIARTGWQDYFPQELGLPQSNIMVKVYRSEDEVFALASMASYEGKPVVDEHPAQDVMPSNVAAYLRGVTTNVRRGTGEENDLLLADLIIYDPILISEIEAGKREVSSGYDYNCRAMENGYAQESIRCNHVAIVQTGRAGSRVAVKDNKPKIKGGKIMAKVDQNTIWGKMLSAFAKDAAPEELAEASKMMNEKGKDEEAPALAVPSVVTEPVNKPAADEDPTQMILKEILIAIKGLQANNSTTIPNAEPVKDALTELADELKDEDPIDKVSEEAVTIDPVQIKDEQPAENLVAATDSRASIMMAINAVKPIVAAIKDPAERKKASDRMAKAFRDQIPVVPTNAYAQLLNPAKAQDAKIDDESALGKKWAKKFNPHYKNRE